MMPESQPWELNALRNLQHPYEACGLQFHINPSHELIPPFLAGYRPDAIAVDPDGGGIIIEVKRHRSGAADRQLAELAKQVAKQVAKQKGWEFRAIYTNPATERLDTIAEPTLGQLDAKLQEIRVLAEAGHYDPALISGWAVLEALARLAGGSGISTAYSPIQAVQALAEEGYIENEEAQRLREMSRLRSSVVHGDFSVNVSAEQVAFLLEQLEALKSSIMKVVAEQEGAGSEVS